MPENFIGELLGAIETRQITSVATQRTQQEIADEAARTVTQFRKTTAPVEQGMLNRRAKQDHARQLTDSGGFMDMATLAGLRMLDPGGYDQEIRAKRNVEDSSFVAAMGEMTNIRLQELQSHLVAAQTQLQGAELIESIALERAEQASKVNELRRTELTSVRLLQDEQIAAMSPDDINASLKDSPNELLSIRGVEIPRFRLVEESRRRELLELTEMAQLSAVTEEDKRRVQRQRLQLMSREELLELRVDGYQRDGQLYTPADVDTAFTNRVQSDDDAVSEAIRNEQLKTLPQGVVTEAAQFVGTVQQAIGPGSPMQLHVKNFKTRIGAAQGLVETGTPAQQAAGLALIQAAQEEYAKQARTQAKRDSPTDKEMEEARYEFYLTGEVPVGRVTDVAIGRLADDKTLVGVLPPQEEKTLRDTYRQVFDLMVSEESQDVLGGTMTQARRKELKREAAAVAWTEFLRQTGGQIANQAYYQQTSMAGIPGTDAPPHPLYGIQSPTKFAQTVKMAETAAIEVLQSQYGLERTQVDAILARGDAAIPEGLASSLTAAQFVAELNHLQATHLMQQFDPAVADRIVDWNAKYGADYIGLYATQARAGAVGFESTTLMSLAADSARDEWFSTVQDMGVALDSARAQAAEQMTNFAFGDPTAWQVVALQADQNLTDSEKSLLWDKIAPIVIQSEHQGLRGRDAHLWIERQIGNLEFETPEGRKAYKTFLRERKLVGDMVRGIIDGVSSMPPFRGSNQIISDRFLLDKAGTIPFYADWRRRQIEMRR